LTSFVTSLHTVITNTQWLSKTANGELRKTDHKLTPKKLRRKWNWVGHTMWRSNHSVATFYCHQHVNTCIMLCSAFCPWCNKSLWSCKLLQTLSRI